VSLKGKHVVVTAGPTHEPIDPVRVIANRSSGRQGFAIAAAAAEAGAQVTLISGPIALGTPIGVERIDVETAQEMADAVAAALPADVAIMVAAVADWRVETSPTKLKKSDGPPKLKFLPNPDILAELAARPDRPRLVVGFAAETERVVENAIAKQAANGTLDLAAFGAEVLRHDPPVQNTRRTLADDVALAGCRMGAGDSVLVVLAAAERDLRRHPEPDRFRLARVQPPALGLGAGPHRCPGGSFALRIAVFGRAVEAGGVAS
jgi:phosphopantothenoylcysteine decarboxylase/phosphopantothenate--cysteine ligase